MERNGNKYKPIETGRFSIEILDRLFKEARPGVRPNCETCNDEGMILSGESNGGPIFKRCKCVKNYARRNNQPGGDSKLAQLKTDFRGKREEK